jgi:hypothetical protein
VKAALELEREEKVQIEVCTDTVGLENVAIN